MPTVFICAPIPENGIHLLRSKGFSVDINKSASLPKEDLIKAFSKYDAVITLIPNKVDAQVVRAASKNLKIISNFAVGFDNVDVLEAQRHNIIVTNTPGVASESVAESVFGLLLALSKKIIEQDKFVRLDKYKEWDPMAFVSPQIWGQTIGIVGLGKIGTFVAQMAFGGFRMKVLYFDVSRSPDFELLFEGKFCTLNELLREADIITLHCPLNEKTRHLIGREQLKMMKKSAMLINTSRGAVIDEDALIWALKEKEIKGAGLDVYEHEPSIPEELRTLSNVVLTPHTASATIETREAMSKIAAENIIAVFEGREPPGKIIHR